MDTQTAITALAAMAQDSRLAIFRLLVQVGPNGMIASKIAQQLSIPPPSLSFHLKELTRADLVISKQDGRFMIYAANFNTMNGLINFLTDNCCGGKACITTCSPAPTKLVPDEA